MENEKPTLQNIAKEVAPPGYRERAHKRARRRRSPWNLILLPLVFGSMGVITYELFRLMWWVHTWYYPEHAGRLGEFWNEGISGTAFASSFLLLVPLFFASIPLGLMSANAIAWFIPPARRVLNREAEGVKLASFREAMQGLWKIALFMVPVCLLLSFIGAATLSSLR